jgi:2-polyprenyl-3-methyl-5-hydroxy-6-metoxy-1,4-benzoquinol methylase
MDDLLCEGEVVNQTLRELEIINRWLGGNWVTINGIKKLIKNRSGLSKISILDIGCGGGDMLKEIADWGRDQGFAMQLTGIDANPNIIEYARENTKGYSEIDYAVQNIFSEEFTNRKSDIVISTLFLHHFDSESLPALLRSLRQQSGIGIVINDLHRHWLAYHSIKLITRLFSKSPMVKYDGPLSVLRAFSKQDLNSILQNAGISDFSIAWKWAFRWQIIIPGSLA